MKKITLLSFFLTASFGFSQNMVTVDVGATWNGYMNVFDNPADGTPDCGGGYCFGSGWGLGDLIATIGGSSITLLPNTNTYNDNPGDAYWRDNNGAGPDGNKIMEANTYVEPGGTFNNVDLTFTVETISNTLDSRYAVVAFIKTVGGTNIYKTVDITSGGVFSVSATASELASGTVQYGFAVTGLNANPATNWGNIEVGPASLGINNYQASSFKAYPNPTNDQWILKGNQNLIEVNVYDILGKTVMSQKLDGRETTLNASTLKSGIYFAKIRSNSGIDTLRLIKE